MNLPSSSPRLLSIARSILPIFAAVLLVVGFASGQGAGKDDWVRLIEGKELAKHWTTKGNWILGENGEIALVPREGEKGWQRYDSYLWSKKQYKDFEAEFEYKVANKGNSGFYFHVGDLKEPVKTGIEVQIFDSFGKAKDAKLTDHDSGGIIPGMPPSKRASKPTGEWDLMRVLVKGRKVIVTINGVVVNDHSLDHAKIKDRPPTGYVGFQDHGMPLWLRNIRIREL